MRITTIYEGTSEIMEMTIARDRWQQHLKTGGALLPARARRGCAHSTRGTPMSAPPPRPLACDALAGVLEACRAGRLTRNQHVLLRLGELIAAAEGAGCFARRAAAALDGELPAKADHRFDGSALAAMSRVFARDAALKVACDGLRWVTGAVGPRAAGDAPLPGGRWLDAAFAAQED